MLYAMVLHDGPKHAVDRIGHFRPWGFALGSARDLIDRLLAERRFEAANSLAAALPDAWAVFLLVPLAMAAQPIDHERLKHGLQSLKRRFKLDSEMLGHLPSENTLGAYVIDTVLSGAEILAAKAISPETVQSLLAPFLDPEIRRIDRRYDFESNHLDAILRCYCLAEALAGREVKAEDVLVSRPTPAPGSEQRGVAKAKAANTTKGFGNSLRRSRASTRRARERWRAQRAALPLNRNSATRIKNSRATAGALSAAVARPASEPRSPTARRC